MKLTTKRAINRAILDAVRLGLNLYLFDGTFWLRCFGARKLKNDNLPQVLCGNGSEPQWRYVTTSTVFDAR